MSATRRLRALATGLRPLPSPSAAPVQGRRRLDGKACFITGAGNGIGRATALLFAAEGCAVGVADRDAEAGEAVAAAIEGKGGRALFVETDVSSEASINAAVAAVAAEFGGLDVLVNVAGGRLRRLA